MAYSFQTFSIGEVFTAAKANQIEVNVRDHVHGSGGVAAVTTAGLDVAANIASFLGAADYAAMRTLLGTIGLDLVATGTAATSSSIDLGDMDTSSDLYVVVGSLVRTVTDGDDIWLRLYDATLGDWQADAADYEQAGVYGTSDSTTIGALRAATDAKILLTVNVGNSSYEPCSFVSFVLAPMTPGFRASVVTVAIWATDGGVLRGSITWGAYRGAQNACSKLRIMASTGNLASGSAALYRVRKT